MTTLAHMAEKKSSQRNVRYPADLVDKISKLSRFLFEEGIHAQESWASTVIVIMRQADKYGLLDTPPTWYTPEDSIAKRERNPLDHVQGLSAAGHGHAEFDFEALGDGHVLFMCSGPAPVQVSPVGFRPRWQGKYTPPCDTHPALRAGCVSIGASLWQVWTRPF